MQGLAKPADIYDAMLRAERLETRTNALIADLKHSSSNDFLDVLLGLGSSAKSTGDALLKAMDENWEIAEARRLGLFSTCSALDDLGSMMAASAVSAMYSATSRNLDLASVNPLATRNVFGILPRIDERAIEVLSDNGYDVATLFSGRNHLSS